MISPAFVFVESEVKGSVVEAEQVVVGLRVLMFTSCSAHSVCSVDQASIINQVSFIAADGTSAKGEWRWQGVGAMSKQS